MAGIVHWASPESGARLAAAAALPWPADGPVAGPDASVVLRGVGDESVATAGFCPTGFPEHPAHKTAGTLSKATTTDILAMTIFCQAGRHRAGIMISRFGEEIMGGGWDRQRHGSQVWRSHIPW